MPPKKPKINEFSLEEYNMWFNSISWIDLITESLLEETPIHPLKKKKEKLLKPERITDTLSQNIAQ